MYVLPFPVTIARETLAQSFSLDFTFIRLINSFDTIPQNRMHAMSLVWVSELPPAPPPQVLQDSSPLLFVECSEHNGRAPRQTQTLRKRHIMRTSKNSARRDAVPAEERRTDIKTHVLDGPVARTSTNGSAVSATAKQNRVQLVRVGDNREVRW